MIRVIIADDHAIVRHGVQRLIEEQADMSVVSELGDGDAVIPKVQSSQCDVLILDLSVPNRSGRELLHQLHREAPDLRIVVLSMYPEDRLALALMQEGAHAYLNKDRDPQELLDAIRRVAEGNSYLTGTLTDLALGGCAGQPMQPHLALTGREHQVFTLLIQDQSVSDIAVELGLSPSTISNHVASIKRKLGAGCIGGIVRYASRVGLV